MTKPARTFAVPALLAALALSATPAAAAELPTFRGDAPLQVGIETADYGGGWGGRHRYRHRGRTSAGDVLGAVLVLGTIAAVANAATRAHRQRSYPAPYPYPSRPYPDRRGDYRPDYRSSGPQGVEGAADLCLREIEREARVEDVAEVERNASGWLVTGALADGENFSCSIGADGRIERIEVGGRARELGDYEARSERGDESYRGADPRYEDGDERFRGAEVEAQAQADDVPLRDYPRADGEAESEPLRDYPGGPLPGEPAEDEPGA